MSGHGQLITSEKEINTNMKRRRLATVKVLLKEAKGLRDFPSGIMHLLKRKKKVAAFLDLGPNII